MFAGPASENLCGQSCAGACSKDTPLVPKEEVPELLKAVPAWSLQDGGKLLSRKFTARNFKEAMKFFNQLAEVAEEEGHHPDFHLTNYRDVEVIVSTHAAGGLTKFDFILASKIDRIEVDYSPKWMAAEKERLAGKLAS